MTRQLLETRPAPSQELGDQSTGDFALQTIDRHRADLHEHFYVTELEREMPYYVQDMGLCGVLLADLTDNDTHTFKWRGAIVKGTVEKERGAQVLVGYSTGNHAAGIAGAARTLGLRAKIGIPDTTPKEKVDNIYDVYPSDKLQVVRKGRTLEEAGRYITTDLSESRLGFVHAYDDAYVGAGQGTVFDDILDAVPDVTDIVASFGGGGLVGGMGLRRDERGKTRQVRLHAVQAPGSNSLSNSIAHGEPTDADNPNQRFGGVAVKRSGNYSLNYMLQADNTTCHTASEEAIDALVASYQQSRRDLLHTHSRPFEPTTLLAMSVLRQIVAQKNDRKIVVVGTGRNAPLEPVHPRSRPARALRGHVR